MKCYTNEQCIIIVKTRYKYEKSFAKTQFANCVQFLVDEVHQINLQFKD